MRFVKIEEGSYILKPFCSKKLITFLYNFVSLPPSFVSSDFLLIIACKLGDIFVGLRTATKFLFKWGVRGDLGDKLQLIDGNSSDLFINSLWIVKKSKIIGIKIKAILNYAKQSQQN